MAIRAKRDPLCCPTMGEAINGGESLRRHFPLETLACSLESPASSLKRLRHKNLWQRLLEPSPSKALVKELEIDELSLSRLADEVRKDLSPATRKYLSAWPPRCIPINDENVPPL